MTIKQNEDGKWCVYDDAGEKLGEYETEEESQKALDTRPSTLASMTSKVRASGDRGEADVKVLFDTGASLSFVLRSVAEKLASITKLPKPYTITIGDGSTLSIKDMAVLSIKAAGQTILDTFLVLEQGVEDVILGEATMRKFGLKIDLEHGVIFSEMKAESGKQKTGNGKETNRKGFSMKEFLQKLFAKLGIAATDEIGEDKAIELVEQRIEALREEKKPPPKKGIAAIYAIPTKLLKAMGLPEDATEEEALAHAALLTHPGDRVPPEQYEELNSQLVEREILDLVAKASNAGTDDFSAKLYPSEREWAITFARDNGLNVAREFIRKRPKVLAIMDRLPGKKEKAVVIDDEQEAINRQLGVSKEMFLKYNGTN